MRSRIGWVGLLLAWLAREVVAVSLMLFATSWVSLGAENGTPAPATNSIVGTNASEVLQAFLQLQAQLRATQLAIEQNRQEAREAATQATEALSNALQTIPETLAAQRARDWAAMQRSNKTVLTVAGTLAVMGVLTMLMMIYFQWRMSKGLAQLSRALPAALGLGTGSAAAALGPAEPSNVRLLGAMEHLEKRIEELEQTSAPALKPRIGPNRILERRPFPGSGESLRRQQFRALKTALIVGLMSSGVIALVLYLVSLRAKP